MNELTTVEQTELEQHEATIEHGLQTFVEVGTALLAIREGRLYRLEYGTFEDYCQERWDFTRMRASQLISAAEVVQNVNNCLQIPATESQARPLTRLHVEDQPIVWQRAVETAPNGKVTAAHVQSVADDYLNPRRFIAPIANDDYEQMADNLAGDEDSYDWTETPIVAPRSSMTVHYSSDKPDWETPQDLFDFLDTEFHFTLDVCATDETAKCKAYFTPDDDGLTQDWSQNTCWMNPPYGDEISDWISKAYKQAQNGAIVVCLVPARVDTGWWWGSCIFGEIRFLKGRLKFKQNGNEESGAPFPSAVIVFSPSIKPCTVWWDWKKDVRI